MIYYAGQAIASCKQLLEVHGLSPPDAAELDFNRYLDLIREWNRFVPLVSKRDLSRLVDEHLCDSISLVPYVAGSCREHGTLLDIGSGAGFPAIPIKIVLPKLRVVLVERSERRVGFLRKVIGALGLQDVDVRLTNFPVGLDGVRPACITARALEQPKKLLKPIAALMPTASVFLCQSGDPSGLLPGGFHVEHVADDWTAAGLRRGTLHLVRRS